MDKTSQVLIALREQSNLTKTAAAEIAGVSVNSYSSWECGEIPKVASGIRLADYYGVTLDYLYGRETERHIETQSGETLTAQEKDLLKLWGTLRERDKLDVLFVMSRLATSTYQSPVRGEGERTVLATEAGRKRRDNPVDGVDD